MMISHHHILHVQLEGRQQLGHGSTTASSSPQYSQHTGSLRAKLDMQVS